MIGKIPNFTDSERMKTPKLTATILTRQRSLSAWIPGLLTLKYRVACHLKCRSNTRAVTWSGHKSNNIRQLSLVHFPSGGDRGLTRALH